jgi:Aldehyde dehydrogenase family
VFDHSSLRQELPMTRRSERARRPSARRRRASNDRRRWRPRAPLPGRWQIANGTSYGLASYLWTNDVGRINRLASKLEAGGVYVNGAMPVTGCELPFGGVGVSGYGREGGQEGLYEFVRTKAVSIR